METKKFNWKTLTLGVLSIGTIGLIATAGIASAYQGDPTKQGPNYDVDLHDLKVEAFNTNDYEVWKDLMEQQGNTGRVLDVVNADNFNTFVEAHNAALEGNMELSKELRASIGLNNGMGLKDGNGFKQGGMGQGKGQGTGNSQEMRGTGQGLNQVDFVDANGDGLCDNTGLEEGSQKGQGKGRR